MSSDWIVLSVDEPTEGVVIEALRHVVDAVDMRPSEDGHYLELLDDRSVTLLVVERAKLVHTTAELARLHPGADVSAPEGSVGIPDLFTSPVAADGSSPVGRRCGGRTCIHQPTCPAPTRWRKPWRTPSPVGAAGSWSHRQQQPRPGDRGADRRAHLRRRGRIGRDPGRERRPPLLSGPGRTRRGAARGTGTHGARRARSGLHGPDPAGALHRLHSSRRPLFGPEALAATGAAPAARLASESGGDARPLGASPAQSLAVQYAQEEIPGRQHPLEAYASLLGALALTPPG